MRQVGPGFPRCIAELAIDIHECVEPGCVLDGDASRSLVIPPSQTSPAEDLSPDWVPPAYVSNCCPDLGQHKGRPPSSPAVEECKSASSKAAFVPSRPLFSGLPFEPQHGPNLCQLNSVDCLQQTGVAWPSLAGPEGALSNQDNMQFELVSEGSPRCEGFTVSPEGFASPCLHLSNQHCRPPMKGEGAA